MIRDYVALDLETTGLSAKTDKIIEIGAIKVLNGEIVDKYETLINPGAVISQRITEVTGITNEMVKDAPYISEKIGELMEFIGELPLLGHNLLFDYSFVKRAAINNGYKFEKMGVDTLKIARVRLKELESKRLDFLCAYYGIEDNNHHRAYNDAVVAHELYIKLCSEFEEESGEPIPLVYSVKKESPITDRQVQFLSDLVRKHNIEIDYDITKLSKNEASRKIDILISTYGRGF